MSAARFFVATGAIVLAAGVAMGAIGAHAVRGAPHPDAMRLVQTAVLYQFVHGLGVLAIGILAGRGGPSRLLRAAGALLLAGVVAFCGSLYVLAFTGTSLGAVAPFGGSSFIAGWLALATWAVREGRG